MGLFDGIITDEFKALHKDAIDALLEDDALTVACRLYYGDTLWTDCSNCDFDAIHGRSSNRYTAGGPVPFPNGQVCPYCSGRGRTEVEQTEEVYLMVLWEMKDWLRTGVLGSLVRAAAANTEDSYAQTLSKWSTTYDKLKRTKEIILDTSVETSVALRFVRMGEPQPCGLGASNYAVTMWRRTGGE